MRSHISIKTVVILCDALIIYVNNKFGKKLQYSKIDLNMSLVASNGTMDFMYFSFVNIFLNFLKGSECKTTFCEFVIRKVFSYL